MCRCISCPAYACAQISVISHEEKEREGQKEEGRGERKGEKKRSKTEKTSTVEKKKAQLMFILGLTLYCLGNV